MNNSINDNFELYLGNYSLLIIHYQLFPVFLVTSQRIGDSFAYEKRSKGGLAFHEVRLPNQIATRDFLHRALAGAL